MWGPAVTVIFTAFLPRGQPHPKILLGVDGDICSEPLRSSRLCHVLLEECVVSCGCQVHDTPPVLWVRVRATDRVFNVKQGLMAAGLKE